VEQIVHETIATPAYDTAQEILDQAASCEADMIVLGSRGMGTIQGYVGHMSISRAMHALPSRELAQLLCCVRTGCCWGAFRSDV
jgi:hypothetical protein